MISFGWSSPGRVGALMIGGACLLPVQIGYAQSLGTERPNELDVVRNRLERQRLEDSIQRQLDEEKRRSLPEATPRTEVARGSGAAFLITDIKVIGDPEPSAARDEVLARYRNTRMGADEMLALIRDLTNYYGQKGYVTTTVTLNRQNIKSGRLQVQVSWGYVQGWQIDGISARTWRQRLLLASLPRTSKRKLNIRDVDQAVEVLNGGLGAATVDIVPAETLSYSYLNIAQRGSKPWSFNVAIDSSGTGDHDAGRYRLNAELTFKGLGSDFWGVSYGQRYFRDGLDEEKNWSAFGTVPIGYWDFELRHTRSEYRRLIGGNFGRYLSSGRSGDSSLKVERVFGRDQTGKNTFFAKLGRRASENFIDDYRLDINSRKYTDISLGLTRVGKFAGGVYYLDAALGKGGSWLGANDIQPDAHGMTPALYDKISGNFNWTRSWQKGVAFSYTARGGWQYGDGPLLAANKIALGDEFTVRGFKGGVVYGDSGAYLSNTLELPLARGRFTPFVGFDVGVAKDRGRASEHLSGAVLGVRGQTAMARWTLAYARPVDRPKGYSDEAVVYINANFRF
ncbi:ShlB/FhaC/HecB family hemolysin secretion/activation protein [Lysobacter sp. CA196]|uniref:ShlB/FhaC/HecB family hemolysin secretion/activation protein n=1 Tax=Lysobacter sp. CA196 TaxID=3455606 RepID=UPI003F8CF97E